MTKTMILGLTGGIASGKSTVSNYFKSLNIPVVDADKIAREVMKAGEPTVHEIKEQFGEEVLLPNGEIDRKHLGDLIFSSPEKREQLNKIVQEVIRNEILKETNRLLANEPTLIVLDIPLLFEANYDVHVDQIMVVYVDAQTQKHRLLKRNKELTEEEAQNRILSQIPLTEKAKRADVVIDNNGELDHTYTQVDEWLETTFKPGTFKKLHSH